jgi:hypothetical protein
MLHRLLTLFPLVWAIFFDHLTLQPISLTAQIVSPSAALASTGQQGKLDKDTAGPVNTLRYQVQASDEWHIGRQVTCISFKVVPSHLTFSHLYFPLLPTPKSCQSLAT